MMIANWKKKHSFHWYKKKNRTSKEIEPEVKDLEEQSENKSIEDLFRLTQDCNAEIKSLKSNVLQMGTILTAFEQAHRVAEYELREFTDEIKMMMNERTLTMEEENRNIEARIICLKNLMALEESHLKMTKMINKFQFCTGISNLECKIKEMKKIASFSNFKIKT